MRRKFFGVENAVNTQENSASTVNRLMKPESLMHVESARDAGVLSSPAVLCLLQRSYVTPDVVRIKIKYSHAVK